MGLIDETVNVRWNGSNKKHYTSLGYEFTKIGNEFKVKVMDLPKGSNVKVKCMCDNCGKISYVMYGDYNRRVKSDGKTYCQKCSVSLISKNKGLKTKLKKSKSFKQWCVENNREDILDRWDYELNKCSPTNVCYSSNKKYWFKCDKHPEHKSELKLIYSFTYGKGGGMECKQCNSIAQYISDNFPNKKLEDIWNYEKNGNLDPWGVSKSTSQKKIWVKCQEKDYHGSYEISCDKFYIGQRCPYCSHKKGKVHPKDSLGKHVIADYGKEFLNKIWSNKNEKSEFEYSCGSDEKVWWKCISSKHDDYKRTIKSSIDYDFRCPKCSNEKRESLYEEKVRLYLVSLGYTILHEYDCTIAPKNPKTKMPLPFDNEIKELKLIIEVHGEQHYDTYYYKHRFNCNDYDAKQKLHYQQLKDRYKKIYAMQNGYEYLEIPYNTIFDSKDTYKQMIDDKIKDILNKNY